MDDTKHMEDILFENDFNSVVIDFLGLESGDIFMSFNERLSRFIHKYANNDCIEPRKYLNTLFKEQNIKFGSKNTNWFSGENPPKKSEDARNKLYKIAFAMKLNIKQTEELFCKVYFDRAFDPRIPQEFIYWYCLNNCLDYATAQEMISEYNTKKQESIETEEALETVYIKEQVISKEINSQNDVVKFILEHPYNFSFHNKKANEVKKLLLNQIMISKEEADEIKVGSYENMKSRIGIEIKNNGKQYVNFKGRQLCSVQFMLDYMFYKGEDSVEYTTIPVEVAKDIRNNFPIKRNCYTKENPTYEELRKMIIVMYFYKFCIDFQYITSEIYEKYNFYDEFIASVNDILLDCGLQEMYLGNPFDWLFAFCAKENNPLEAFRFYMNEILEIE